MALNGLDVEVVEYRKKPQSKKSLLSINIFKTNSWGKGQVKTQSVRGESKESRLRLMTVMQLCNDVDAMGLGSLHG